VLVGGSVGRREATGRGIVYTFYQVMRRLRRETPLVRKSRDPDDGIQLEQRHGVRRVIQIDAPVPQVTPELAGQGLDILT